MSDEPEVVVPEVKVKHLPTIHAGNAREKALKKAEIERTQKLEAQKRRRIIATTALGDQAEAAEIAAHNTSLDKKSVEELAELAVRRMAKVVLLGGEAFAPTTLREASEAANAWANIAYKEAQKRKATPDTADSDATPAEEAAKAMRVLKMNLARQRKQAAGE